MYVFLIKNYKLFEKYNENQEKGSNSIRKKFNTEAVHNKKYLKTKIKSYKGKINTTFYNNKIPKEGSQCICLLVILIDSVYRKDKNYYPQALLEECKQVLKERCLSLLMTTQKFLLMILIKKILMEKILMKKRKYKKMFLEKYKKFLQLGAGKFHPEI